MLTLFFAKFNIFCHLIKHAGKFLRDDIGHILLKHIYAYYLQRIIFFHIRQCLILTLGVFSIKRKPAFLYGLLSVNEKLLAIYIKDNFLAFSFSRIAKARHESSY